MEGDPFEWLDSMMMDEGESAQNRRPICNTVPKVPEWLRKLHPSGKKNWYDPIGVSIGPYHHGKEELQRMENLKSHFAREFVRRAGNPVQSIYADVLAFVHEARILYAQGSTDRYDNLSFGKMMFLDGCFILQFIYWMSMQMQERMKMKKYDIAIVRHDLFLLENQLPFKVLLKLGERNTNDLDLLRLFTARTIDSSKPHISSFPVTDTNQVLDVALVYLTKAEDVSKDTYSHYSRHSAKDLRKVGISLRPNRTQKLNDVTFHTRWARGTLTLPRIDVDDTTITMLLNLVAREHTCGMPPRVANYICFLDSIISNAEDVKELKYAGILSNFLNSDEEAAAIIREIATGLVPDDTESFAEVKRRIESYHTHIGRTRIATWVTEVMRDYFRSPWTAIAIFYAMFAIFLSIVQTYFTVFPNRKH